MRYFPLHILFGLLALLGTACQQEILTESTKGCFQITLLDDTEATDILTKASPLKLPAFIADEFHLTITKESNGYVLYDGGYTSEPIPASPDSYMLETTFGENSILEINNPYFVGKKTGVEVKANEPTLVELPCRLANALTSVRFGEQDVNRSKFDELYAPGYGVKIVIGNYFAVLTDSLRVAYYKAGTKPSDVSLSFVGTIKGNGQEVEYPLTTDLFPVLGQAQSYVAGAHIRLVLDMAPMATGLIPTIVSAEVVQETIEETFPMEWLPKPQVETRGDFDSDHKILFYETEQPAGSIKFNSALGLQDLKFTIDFNDPIYHSLNGDYTLSALTEAQKQAFADAGIVLPVLDDTPENDSIGFSKTFTTALTYTVNKANVKKEVSNVIRLNEVIANGKTLTPTVEGELDYEIAIKKAPKFRVSVDERNVWSKSFTADVVEVTNVAEGADADAVKAAIVYQYNKDGKGWNDCSDSPNRSHMFESHPAETERTVSVRAMFRNFTSSNRATIELEEPIQLPNSKMDEWSDDNYQGSRYSYNPWSSGDNLKFWDTSNLFTTRHRTNSSSATMANYNGMPSVSYVPGRSGWAAEIRSTANGKANTRLGSWHTEQNYNKVAGELYTGTAHVTTGSNDANASSDTHTRVKDAEHSSRPTALKFWYKYKPHSSGEKYSVLIEILDTDGNVIVSNTLAREETVTNWSEMTVPLTYTSGTLYKKCAYIYVLFCSTSVTGTNMKYSEQTWTLYKNLNVNDTYSFSPAYVGSILTIDDISLIYDK
ncbi:MAG: DUF4493 domain-containing protein [Parabacteroides sp.]|nr:DUF4493 domain-containing protein [Parabacteroides sp.]